MSNKAWRSRVSYARNAIRAIGALAARSRSWGPRRGGTGSSWAPSVRLGAKRRRASSIGVVARRRRRMGRWKSFMGTRRINKRPRYNTPAVEKHTIYQQLADNIVPMPFLQWHTGTVLHEMHVNWVPTSYTYGSGTWNRTGVLAQSAGEAGYTGVEYCIKQMESRYCMEAGADQKEALCCRMVVIQIMDDSNDKGSGTFTLGDFYENSNITSFRKQEPQLAYKILVDKTFTISPENGGAQFADRHTVWNFPIGKVRHKQDVTTSGQPGGPGNRILFGFYTEIAPTFTQIDGLAYSSDAPQYYGSYKFVWTDE